MGQDGSSPEELPPGVRILPSDDSLRRKVRSADGLSPEAMLERAASAIDGLRDDYRKRLPGQIAALTASLHAPVLSDPAGGKAARQQAFRQAHDLKGTAGTFGFALVSAAADSLCRVLQHGRVGEARYGAVLAAHGDALDLIARAVASGDEAGLTGEPGQALLAGLSRAASRVVG